MRAEEGNPPAVDAPEQGVEPAPVIEEPDDAESESVDESSAPEAVIFVPAIGPWTDQDLGTIALRIVLALEEQASEEKVFSVTAAAHDLVYGKGETKHKSSVHTISVAPRPGGYATDAIDLYEMDYAELFPKRFEDASALKKSMYVGTSAVTAILRFFRRFRGPGISKADKTHFLFASILVLGLTIYAGVLVYAVAQAAWSTIDEDEPARPRATPAEENAEADPITLPQKIALALTGAGLLTPKARKTVERISIDYVSAIRYLTLHKDRGEIESQLASLLEEVAQTGQYDRIHLIGYSFGSLVSLDALFPIRKPSKPRFDRIDCLVTVGCPVDLVRTYWPKYLEARNAPPSAPAKWINVWAPGDTFSSNFRDDADSGPATVPIATRASGAILPENVPVTTGPAGEDLHILEAFMMRGLKNHALYWSTAPEGLDPGSFSDIVPRVWPDLVA